MKINWFKLKINQTFIIKNIYLSFIGQYIQFYKFMIFLKIGIKCKDCNKFYNSCVCDSSINYLNLNQLETSEIICQWFIYNLSKKQLKTIIYILNNYNNIHTRDKKFNEGEEQLYIEGIRFLKSYL